MNKPHLILTTSDQRDVLQTIATHLVDKRFAACCQISGPITSYYQWEGETKTGYEYSLSIKTTGSQIERIVQEVSSLHNYDEPEIVAVEIVGGSKSYLEWVASQSTGSRN